MWRRASFLKTTAFPIPTSSLTAPPCWSITDTTHGFGASAATTSKKVNGVEAAATTSAVTTTAGVGLAGGVAGSTSTLTCVNGQPFAIPACSSRSLKTLWSAIIGAESGNAYWMKASRTAGRTAGPLLVWRMAALQPCPTVTW